MRTKPYPGYEEQLECYHLLAHGTKEEKDEAFRRQQRMLRSNAISPAVAFEERIIPGTEPETELLLRFTRPKDLAGDAPIVLDIHGGGWLGGTVAMDDFRNSLLAEGIGCIVAAVEYRLAPAHPFPAALLDCHAALRWLRDNAAELGGDPARIGVYGTSAGGNIAAGLALYLRDHGGPQPALTALISPALTLERLPSHHQMADYAMADMADWAVGAENLYLGGLEGALPSYYAFPAYCTALGGVGPTAIVAAEYDPLRDEALAYARRLMEAEVPCELILAPRVGHAYISVDHPLTRWTMDGLSASFRREFGITQ